MKILVVDDSLMYRTVVKQALSEIPNVEILSAGNGKVAIELIKSGDFDLVTMDIEMPVMDGKEACRSIREFNKNIVIIVLSGTSNASANKTLEALSFGANDFISKIEGTENVEDNIIALRNQLTPKIKALVKTDPTIKESNSLVKPVNKVDQELEKSSVNLFSIKNKIKIPELITISCSTGGPETLRKIFSQLNEGFKTPILIVQHMPPVFSAELAKMLDRLCTLKVKEAQDGDFIKNGEMYVCPGDFHMELVKNEGGSYQIKLNQDEKECYVRPSANFMLRSVAKNFKGHTANFVLTGMGDDGNNGCEHVKNAHHDVFIQNEETSVVWGMPGAVHKSGNFDYILSLDDIPEILNILTL